MELADGFISNFWSADRAVRWTAAETEYYTWLDPRTVLVGTIDAEGVTEDGEPFWADWKTISAGRARNMEQVKAEWRFDPQALTYGVLKENVRRFTVRWAIKDKVPRYDFEWYSYTQAEIDWWANELLNTAAEIRRLRASTKKGLRGLPNWPTNPSNCLRYGWMYRCPLYDDGCPKLNFEHVPKGMGPQTHHGETKAKLMAKHGPDLVILSSSSVETWLGCHEKYRRFYEGKGLTDSSEALTIGLHFHAAIAQHITGLINGRSSS